MRLISVYVDEDDMKVLQNEGYAISKLVRQLLREKADAIRKVKKCEPDMLL